MGRDYAEKLAIHGGPCAKRTPFPKGKRHGEREKALLGEVIDSDMLFYFQGTKVFDFQKRYGQLYGSKHCVACSSGTAANHIAVGALQLPAGREVIVPAITDMGTLTGILYQGLVPVFADVDPDTLNIDPDSARRLVNSRTAALMVVHHSGLAADLDAFLALGKEFGLPIIEDCAQAYLTLYKNKLAGTIGTIAAFSLNHFKHITCGSGGMLLTNDDKLRHVASLFVDKCFQREEGIRNPFFLAPNYQMTELQGAVALAQLERLPDIVARRRQLGNRLNETLGDISGIVPQLVPPGCEHSYFMFLFRLDLDVLRCGADEFARALAAEGIPNSARQITGGRPVYLYDLFQKRSAFPGSAYPFCQAGTERRYQAGDCPVAEQAFDRWITMNLYEHYREIDIDEIVHGIGKVARHFSVKTIAAGS